MAHKFSCIELLPLLVLSGLLLPGTVKFALSTGRIASDCFESEREALAKLKGGFTDPSGRLASWVGKDCCRWRGIVCSNPTGRVVGINLRNPHVDDNLSSDLKPGQALRGEISPSLLDVKELNYLDLSMNNFGGTKLPGFIGSLKQLRYLNLSGASFGGVIPPSLGNLSQLRYLDLSNCFAGSSQNDLLWLPGLSSLRYLNLGAIDLSKAADYWLRAINSLPSLMELRLPNCVLSKLPLALPFINVTSLEVLDLSNNNFNSTSPRWLFNLTRLVHLDLNSNSLGGELPDEFANLASLQELDMSQNSYLKGRLPKSLGSLCNLNVLKLSVNRITGEITDLVNGLAQCNDSKLEYLDLGNNTLSGNLPDSLGNLKRLRYLQFWQNSFQGSIPRSIGNMSSLKEFNLANNKMSGIPESFGQLSTLVAVYLSENLWEGVVTERHLANLSSLTDLDLRKLSPNISLAFNIAPGWDPPFKLRYLNIRSCQLGPEFPTWLRNQNELKTVVLNNAKILGTIPDWFLQLNLQLDELDVAYNQLTGKPPTSLMFVGDQSNVDLSSNLYEGPLPMWSSNVTTLYLRDNRFSGPIPPKIGELMPDLTDLDISRNGLNGTIPLSIGNMANLTTLVISVNNLSGEIPRFWSNLSMLYILDMSNNSLSGPIPSEVGFLSYLTLLILSNNNLSGKLPSSLRNCSSLRSLDLGENKFSGNIPAWIAESIPSLLILRLRSNSFTGEIPPQICRLSNLHIVDLSHNSLSGSIPPCIGNLTGLKVELTNADMRYEGRLTVVAKGRAVQYDQSILYLVNSLDLSDNRLSGEIPEALSRLVRLWTLNLSMNHLTGRIPINIGNLEWLETLDLSSSNLSGPLPPSMPALTKLNHLNLSYNDLSGKIPTTNQFQTLNDPSIYKGNAGLCGIPLPELCPEDEKQPRPPSNGGGNSKNKDGDDDLENFWLFLSIGLGFAVGFWGVYGTLMVKKSWREAYYGYVDRMKNKLIALIAQSD